MSDAAARDRALRAPFPDAHVLVVDDDERLRRLLKRYIESAGYRVTGAAEADVARRLLASLRFDLLVVDVMMPGESGLDLTASLRGSLRTPVLLLSALGGDPEHRIAGLEQGADDYLGKPFEPRELLLRMRSVLHRARETPELAVDPDLLRFGEVRYDVTRGEFRWEDGSVEPLTGAEAELMRVFARRPREALGRGVLLAALRSGPEHGQDRAIDVRVARIRKKLEPAPGSPRYLKTVRGAGYMLVPDKGPADGSA